MATTSAENQYPRAAVSSVVACCLNKNPRYLLIQRGNPPNKGVWSFPGGKLEPGESTISGAKRELMEETTWTGGECDRLRWYPHTLCTSDSIGEGYHFVIAQCYAELVGNLDSLPEVDPDDDAAAANWFSSAQVEEMVGNGDASPGLDGVINRVEELRLHGLLPTS